MNNRGELSEFKFNLNYFGLLTIYLVIWPFRHVKNKGGLNFERYEYYLLRLFCFISVSFRGILGKASLKCNDSVYPACRFLLLESRIIRRPFG